MKQNTGSRVQWDKYGICPACHMAPGQQCVDVRNAQPIDRPHPSRKYHQEPEVCSRPHPRPYQGIRTFCVSLLHHQGPHVDGKKRRWTDLTTRV